MSQAPEGQFTNIILKKMNAPDRALLASSFERVRLNQHMVIESAGEMVEYVYFVEEGMLSVVSRMDAVRDVEVGVIGSEGMSGSAIALGDDQSVHQTNVQVAGWGIRLPASDMREALRNSRSLFDLVLLYVRTLDLQTASTASANSRAKLEERLARWLLMTHDRVGSDRIDITHEFLANMLACRRPGVTVALHMLEGKGLIRSNRGQIIIVDRQGLKAEANGSYGAAEREYERLLGEDIQMHQPAHEIGAMPQLSIVPHSAFNND
jgi:CRP-like cAMP-binding protein